MPKRTAKKPKPKANSLALTGDYGLPEAQALKRQLTTTLKRPTPVTLDVTALTRIDTANLQLLVAFVRERQAKSRAVTWQGVPTWLNEAAQRLGLTAALQVARA